MVVEPDHVRRLRRERLVRKSLLCGDETCESITQQKSLHVFLGLREGEGVLPQDS
jgi:hypothetical protein